MISNTTITVDDQTQIAVSGDAEGRRTIITIGEPDDGSSVFIALTEGRLVELQRALEARRAGV